MKEYNPIKSLLDNGKELAFSCVVFKTKNEDLIVISTMGEHSIEETIIEPYSTQTNPVIGKETDSVLRVIKTHADVLAKKACRINKLEVAL